MLSTMHEKGDEPYTTKLQEIIKCYNSTKEEEVDTLEQMCHSHSTGRKTCRWLLCLSYKLLDNVGYNSYQQEKISEYARLGQTARDESFGRSNYEAQTPQNHKHVLEVNSSRKSTY